MHTLTEKASYQVPDPITEVEHEGPCQDELGTKDDCSPKVKSLNHLQVVREGTRQHNSA